MQGVTILILTKNEEINLPDCLKSVKGFAKRCVLWIVTIMTVQRK